MIVTNQLVSINFSGLSGTLPTTWDLSPTYPNGALDPTHITARTYSVATGWSTWGAITAFNNDTNVATFTLPAGTTKVEFRRSTPRYTVYRNPTTVSSRVSEGNLQANADQGLYTAIEWAAQFGIDAQAVLLPGPGQVPNTLGLQQQTQNYWGAADYSAHVWDFSFAGGYIERSHVKAQILLEAGWTLLTIDTDEYVRQFNYELREDGGLELNEDGTVEAREGITDPNDANTAPFRFIGPFQLYMDFSTLGEVPQALIIYRHTPRNVKVSSLVDDARITGTGMEPSALHALFVAVELGEQLSQYTPPCDCFTSELETLSWHIPDSSVHTPSQSVTLSQNPDSVFTIDLRITADMEQRGYDDPALVVVGGGGRFITAPTPHATTVAGGDPAKWTGFNIYSITVSDPPQVYYVNRTLVFTDPVENHIIMDGSDAFKLTIEARGNATITFAANDVNNGSAFYPQFGTVTAQVVSVITT